MYQVLPFRKNHELQIHGNNEENADVVWLATDTSIRINTNAQTYRPHWFSSFVCIQSTWNRIANIMSLERHNFEVHSVNIASHIAMPYETHVNMQYSHPPQQFHTSRQCIWPLCSTHNVLNFLTWAMSISVSRYLAFSASPWILWMNCGWKLINYCG